jgi:hypothetical protein
MKGFRLALWELHWNFECEFTTGWNKEILFFANRSSRSGQHLAFERLLPDNPRKSSIIDSAARRWAIEGRCKKVIVSLFQAIVKSPSRLSAPHADSRSRAKAAADGNFAVVALTRENRRKEE